MGWPTWRRGSTTTTGTLPTRLLTENPYELTSVFGVGFLIADRIARATRADGAERTPGAGCDHARAVGIRAQRQRLHAARRPSCQRRGSCSGPTSAEDVVDQLERSGAIVREREWIYRTATAELEAELAERIDSLVRGEPSERLRDRPGPGRAAAD